jgi:hypothetical protein
MEPSCYDTGPKKPFGYFSTYIPKTAALQDLNPKPNPNNRQWIIPNIPQKPHNILHIIHQMIPSPINPIPPFSHP